MEGLEVAKCDFKLDQFMEAIMRWRDMSIEKPPKDGNAVLALGNDEAAAVWFDPTEGATWVIMNLPLRGKRISDTLSTFHSWCPINEWHRQTNGLINPSYYGI